MQPENKFFLFEFASVGTLGGNASMMLFTEGGGRQWASADSMFASLAPGRKYQIQFGKTIFDIAVDSKGNLAPNKYLTRAVGDPKLYFFNADNPILWNDLSRDLITATKNLEKNGGTPANLKWFASEKWSSEWRLINQLTVSLKSSEPIIKYFQKSIRESWKKWRKAYYDFVSK